MSGMVLTARQQAARARRGWDVERALDMWAEGKNRAQIAEAVGASSMEVKIVLDWAREMGDPRMIPHPKNAGQQRKWPAEREAALRELWAQRLSCSEVGRILGVTRNAVIGKVHRLGLEKRGGIGVAGGLARGIMLRAQRKARLEARRVRGLRFVKQSSITGEWFKVPPKSPQAKKTEWRDPPEPPEVRRLTLMQLEADDCRFPLGDPAKPGFSFCGCKRLSLWPYCEYHQSITRVAGTHL